MYNDLLTRHSRLFVVAAALLCVAILPVSAQKDTKARENTIGPVEMLNEGGAGSTLLGSYLSGRVARSAKDNEAAARFYSEALDRDAGNKFILEEAFQLELATGNSVRAKSLALRLIKIEPGHKLGRMFLGVDAFNRGDYKAAETYFKNTTREPLADMAASIARAWVQIAKGKPSDAFKIMADLSKEEWAQYFERYHTALMADVSGRQKIARPAYAAAYKRSMRNPRLAEAYARHAVASQDRELAGKILAPLVARALPNPNAKALLDELALGGAPGLMVANAKQGIAEIFYGIGEALTTDTAGADLALSYLQLALMVNPDFSVARYTLAELYDAFKSYEMSIAAFDKVPENSPLWFSAQMRKAFQMHALERSPEAQELLKKLLERDKHNLQILQAMGTILRGEKKYEEAVHYYAIAIDSVTAPDRRAAQLYYNRAVAYERWKQWGKAEADFRKSLELDGEQAQVLNYLGYSWVDQNMNIKEAMALIKKAVALKPSDGFFVDSLGWAYYRQREYREAVKQLDHAVELQPEDPVINDHLGDAFWRVGRRREAKFQWSLALTLNPEAEDHSTIKRKLHYAEAGNILGVTTILNQDWVSTMTRAERVFAKALAKQF